MRYQNPSRYEDYWKTAISEIDDNSITIRGYPLDEITGHVSYTDALILCIRGELPGEVESRCVNAALTACLDHQFLNSTAFAARIVVSANPDPVVGMGAGVLSFGKVTAGVPGHVVELIDRWYPADGSADEIEAAAEAMIADFFARDERVPGFGHPLHSIIGSHYTYRSQIVRDRLEDYGLRTDRKIKFYEDAHSAFLSRVSKRLPINVDGIIGAMFAELDYAPLEVQALGPFTLLPGIAAHVVEELREGSPLRIVPESRYVGPARRSRLADSGGSG